MSTNGHNGYFGDKDNRPRFECEPKAEVGIVNPAQEAVTVEPQHRDSAAPVAIITAVGGLVFAAGFGLIAMDNNRAAEREAREGKVLEGVVGEDGFTYKYDRNDTIYDDSATIVIGMAGPAEGSACSVRVEAKVERDANGTIIDAKDYTLKGHAYPRSVTEHQGGLPPQVKERVVGPEVSFTVQDLAGMEALAEPLNPCVYIAGHSAVNGVQSN